MDYRRHNVALAAGIAALLLLAGGYIMRGHENDKADKQSMTNGFYNAIMADSGEFGGRDETIEPKRTASNAMFIVGGFAALTVLIVLSTGGRSSDDGESLAGQLTRLNELHSTGAITTDEYVAAKTQLLRPPR